MECPKGFQGLSMISKKSILRVIFVLLPLIVLIGAFIAYEQYTKPHRAVEEEASIAIEASQLFREFEADEMTANQNYLNKVLSVTGTVVAMNTNQEGASVIILETENPMFGVSCTLQEKNDSIKVGNRVTIKGICTGYLSDVVVNRGILINVQ
jgi:uncharacterized protein YpmB